MPTVCSSDGVAAYTPSVAGKSTGFHLQLRNKTSSE
jgi:hypothetical protein